MENVHDHLNSQAQLPERIVLGLISRFVVGVFTALFLYILATLSPTPTNVMRKQLFDSTIFSSSYQDNINSAELPNSQQTVLSLCGL